MSSNFCFRAYRPTSPNFINETHLRLRFSTIHLKIPPFNFMDILKVLLSTEKPLLPSLRWRDRSSKFEIRSPFSLPSLIPFLLDIQHLTVKTRIFGWKRHANGVWQFLCVHSEFGGEKEKIAFKKRNLFIQGLKSNFIAHFWELLQCAHGKEFIL